MQWYVPCREAATQFSREGDRMMISLRLLLPAGLITAAAFVLPKFMK